MTPGEQLDAAIRQAGLEMGRIAAEEFGRRTALMRGGPLAVSKERAAEMLSISVGSLDRLVSRGVIVPSRLGDRRLVFSVDELERVVRDGRLDSEPGIGRGAA